MLSDVNNNYDAKLKWDSLKSRDIEKYCQTTQVALSKVKVHAETHICMDLLCKDNNHISNIENLYRDISDTLINAGGQIFNSKDKRNTNVPGWTDYVSDIYEFSKETRSLWLSHGQPRQGPIYHLHMKTKMKVKYAIRFVKKNEAQLRRDSLAKK